MSTMSPEQVANDLREANHKLAEDLKAADERRETRRENRDFWSKLVMAIATLTLGTLQVIALAWLNQTYHLTNSMKTELVKSVRAESHAQGVLEGRKQK